MIKKPFEDYILEAYILSKLEGS